MSHCITLLLYICYCAHPLLCVHIALLSLLQPENILLYRKGQLDIKIADFGLSVQVKAGQEMKTLVGTAEYVCKFCMRTC